MKCLKIHIIEILVKFGSPSRYPLEKKVMAEGLIYKIEMTHTNTFERYQYLKVQIPKRDRVIPGSFFL